MIKLEAISVISSDHFSATTIEPITIHEFTRQIARQYENFMALVRGTLRTSTLNQHRQTLIVWGAENIKIDQVGYSPRGSQTPKEPEEFGESNTFLVNSGDTIPLNRFTEFRDYLKRHINGASHGNLYPSP